MDRKNKILRHIRRDGRGVEIGPSHNPVAPKREGFDVHIIDHLSRGELVQKYQEHGVNLDAIEEVDFVWQGESYADLTGHVKYYDWILASHLIEHTPDLIGFLKNCDAILREDGVISLVVPDKRFCFDRFRPISGLQNVVDSHLNRNTKSSPGAVAEYFLNVVNKSGSIAWNHLSAGEYNFIHGLEEAKHGVEQVLKNDAYLDVHSWCFVPHSFRLLINDLYSMGFIPFQEVGFSSGNGCEFFVTLGRSGKGLDTPRLEMLHIIEQELAFERQALPHSYLGHALKTIRKCLKL